MCGQSLTMNDFAGPRLKQTFKKQSSIRGCSKLTATLKFLIICLEFIFHIFWQTFFNLCLFQGRSQVAGGPEASKNSKKSAKRNEKKIREILSKTCYFRFESVLTDQNSKLILFI